MQWNRWIQNVSIVVIVVQSGGGSDVGERERNNGSSSSMSIVRGGVLGFQISTSSGVFPLSSCHRVHHQLLSSKMSRCDVVPNARQQNNTNVYDGILSADDSNVQVVAADDDDNPYSATGDKTNVIHGREASLSDPNDDGSSLASSSIPMVMEGGPEMIFAMARKMGTSSSHHTANGIRSSPTSRSSGEQEHLDMMSGTSSEEILPVLVPRWHPHGGIADYNPSFRDKAPVMNSMGYANVIRRNSRKKNKPAMWKYALRTYDRMIKNNKVAQKDVHHEGALVACSKLGHWKKALDIYRLLEKEQQQQQIKHIKSNIKNRSRVTDGMVMSLVIACVRGSKLSSPNTTPTTTTSTKTSSPLSQQQQRDSLDVARDVLSSLKTDSTALSHVIARVRASKSSSHTSPMQHHYKYHGNNRRESLDVARDTLSTLEARHGIPVVARHVNSLAAAYQSLNLQDDAAHLVQTHLKRREVKSELDDPDRLNISDISSKDVGSYNLLVKGAVANRDWVGAVEALEEMTESGVYPNTRCLNTWLEVSESGSYRSRGSSSNDVDDQMS